MKALETRGHWVFADFAYGHISQRFSEISKAGAYEAIRAPVGTQIFHKCAQKDDISSIREAIIVIELKARFLTKNTSR